MTTLTGRAGITVVNPSTGGVAGTCAETSVWALDEAVAAAQRASVAWGADPDRRMVALEVMASVLADNADDLARLLSQETGVPLKDTRFEVLGAAGFLRHRATTPLPVDVIHHDDRQSVVVVRRPIGVVGAILPWNAPLLVGAEKISGAFAAGNTVIVKPSPLAPLAMVRLEELLTDHLPPGALQVVVGDDKLGAAMVEHPGIGMISFTGSTRAGRAIMGAAAPRLKRLSLELGGNDAAVVLPDVDVARVAPKLFMGAFYRSGQICVGIKRVYAHADVAGPLVEALAGLAAGALVGDPFDPQVTLGPVSNRPQLERVSSLVDGARAAGATVVTGGDTLGGQGTFYAPTILTGAGEGVEIVAEEQFGPALPVLTWTDLDEVVAAANGTDYGLGASVWSADTAAAAPVAARLQAGTVWINRHGIVAPEVPFGGVKQSGVGRAGGDVGVDAYAELTTLSTAHDRPRTTT